jgi:hypothetical protein
MRILSIDVGIKHLAYCLLSNDSEKGEKSIKIMKWDSINVAEAVDYKCSLFDKEGKPCQQPAKFKKETQCFCLKHAKKQSFHIPTSKMNAAFIKKQKFQSLYELADTYKIEYKKPISKLDLQSLLLEYIYTTCFEPIEETNASKLDLVTIGRNMTAKWDSILFEFEGNNGEKDVLSTNMIPIDKIIIENQISPIANRMKTLQGMIAQYFIMRYNKIGIEFVNASNKLKTPSSSSIEKGNKEKSIEKSIEKSTYSERKKLGIERTQEYIKKDEKWNTYFSQHKKKDDLADSFLQGMWYLSKTS